MMLSWHHRVHCSYNTVDVDTNTFDSGSDVDAARRARRARGAVRPAPAGRWW